MRLRIISWLILVTCGSLSILYIIIDFKSLKTDIWLAAFLIIGVQILLSLIDD